MHGHDTEFGVIIDADNIDTIKYRIAYYNNGLGKFTDYGNWLNYYDFNVDGVIWNKFPGAITNNNGVYTLRLLLNTTNYQNCLIQWQISPIDIDLVTLYGDFYLQNTKTKYGTIDGDTSGTIYIFPSTTFSGDYANAYNQQEQDNINQENTDKIINSVDNINDSITSTEGSDDLINSYLSGDIDSWSSDLGYHPFENPFTSFLYNLVVNVYDALTRRGNVVLDFNHHNTTGWVINTDDFITPNSPLKNLIKWSMIFFYLYGNYKFFHYLLTLIETAKIDKAIATLGTDEFYDSDIM